MHIDFRSPKATEMILEILSAFPPTKAPSRRWQFLLLAVCLLADVATARPHQCLCWKQIHTVRCIGCSRLPNNVPPGVSRLNMTGNRVTRVHFATKVSTTLAHLTSIYLTGNNIETLRFGDLSPLKSLMVLDLSANNLVSVDQQSIASNNQLKRLILDGNPQLQLVALYSQSLEHLYLQNCGLTSFNKRLLRHLPNLRGLYLRGNDELPCEQVVQDIHQDWPQLNVYCDGKTADTKSKGVTTVSSEATSPNPTDIRGPVFVPNLVYWDVPPEEFPSQTPDSVPQKVQLVVPIPVVPLVIILAVVLVVILFRFCRAKQGKPADGRLLEEPR